MMPTSKLYKVNNSARTVQKCSNNSVRRIVMSFLHAIMGIVETEQGVVNKLAGASKCGVAFHSIVK